MAGRALRFPPGVWLREPVREMTVFADQYDFAISLLLLEDHFQPVWHAEPADLEDTFERFAGQGTLGTDRH
jgi:hypothetical protein